LKNFLQKLKLFFETPFGRAIFTVGIFLSSFFAVFSAVPSVVAYSKKGIKDAYIGLGLSFLILVFVDYKFALLFLLLTFLSFTLTISFHEKKFKFSEILFYSIFSMLLAFLIIFVIYGFITSTGIYEAFESNLKSIILFLKQEKAQVFSDMLKQNNLTEKGFIKQSILSIPQFTIYTASLICFINLIFLSKRNENLANYLSLSNLKKVKIREDLAVPAIIIGAMYLFFNSKYSNSLNLAFLSTYLFYSIYVVFFFYGLAISYVFIFYKNKSPFFGVLIFSLLLVFLNWFVSLVGFFDIWFDFRKYLKNIEEK
jgi:hypothetical protein